MMEDTQKINTLSPIKAKCLFLAFQFTVQAS